MKLAAIDELPTSLHAFKIQQREEGLRFDGAIKVHTNASGVTFATFRTADAPVEVLVHDNGADIGRRIDWGYHGISHYGQERSLANRGSYDAAYRTEPGIWWKGYNIYHRRHWSPRHGGFLRVTLEGMSYGNPDDAKVCPYGITENHYETCPA